MALVVTGRLNKQIAHGISEITVKVHRGQVNAEDEGGFPILCARLLRSETIRRVLLVHVAAVGLHHDQPPMRSYRERVDNASPDCLQTRVSLASSR
jgi:hypothetical protein